MDLEALLGWRFPAVEQEYGADDAILYALAVGLGSDPVDARQVRFVYEDCLVAFPTLPCVLGPPGFWASDPRFGIDWKRVLHGEQSLAVHAEIPPSGRVVSDFRITEVVDKGPDVGAFVYSERTVADALTGTVLATLGATTVCRGDGGFGGPPRRREPGAGQGAARAGQGAAGQPPQRPPDHVCDLPTLPQGALLYRLTGDRNPLHADPDVAREVGFDAPILHGLCTFGVAAHALLRTLCDYEATRLEHIEARFSAPVVPGDVVRTSMWEEPDGVRFEATAGAPARSVLSRGFARLG